MVNRVDSCDERLEVDYTIKSLSFFFCGSSFQFVLQKRLFEREEKELKIIMGKQTKKKKEDGIF